MSVRDELSSEVAAALLTMSNGVSQHDMKEVLFLFRSTLRALSSEENRRRRARLLPEQLPGLSRGAASRPS